MDHLLALPDERRQVLFDEAGARLGLSAGSVEAGVADRALADPDLFARVAAHRVVFFRKSQEAQASLQPGRLRMTPSSERRTAWKQDYDAMRESMFFGEAPTFDAILTVVADFERRFNGGASSPW